MAAVERAHAKTLEEYLSPESDEARQEALEEFLVGGSDVDSAATKDAA